MAIYFTGDQHFKHGPIISFCKRPFNNIKSMENACIQKYNDKITQEDTVFHLGDFTGPDTDLECWGWIRRIVRKLNGQKHLIVGNHDTLPIMKYIDAGFTSAHTALQLPGVDRKIILAHDPAIATALENCILICAHIHQLFRKLVCKDNNVTVINVGVDVWDFRPVSLGQVIELANKETTQPF